VKMDNADEYHLPTFVLTGLTGQRRGD